MSLLDSLPVNVITPLPKRTLEGLLPIVELDWVLLDEKGQTALAFTSFLDIDYQNQGTVLSYPVEEGGFEVYNKVSKLLAINATIGQQGTDSDFALTLSKLEDYKVNTTKLSIVTPSAHYKNMTLETFSYTRTSTSPTGLGLLAVKATFKEVREVKTQVMTGIITEPQNPTSAGKTNTGQKQPNTTNLPNRK